VRCDGAQRHLYAFLIHESVESRVEAADDAMKPMQRTARIVATVPVIGAVTVFTYVGHAKAFTAGFIYLLPIMLIAFRWGFLEAAVASVIAVGCLDYFFTEPLFTLYQQDPQDWVALGFFEALALLTSHFANHLERKVEEAKRERARAERLYRIIRDILLMHRRRGVFCLEASSAFATSAILPVPTVRPCSHSLAFT
jgi:K+-sensing histidine kinase KdpD